MAEAVVLQIVVETPNCSNPTCTHDVHSDLTIFFQHLQPEVENTMLQNPVSDSVIQLLTKIQNVVCFLLGNCPVFRTRQKFEIKKNSEILGPRQLQCLSKTAIISQNILPHFVKQG